MRRLFLFTDAGELLKVSAAFRVTAIAVKFNCFAGAFA